MIFARRDRALLLHGARAGRVFKQLRSGAPACATVTLVDGLVLARSAFHHSVNYRSVVAFGRARDAEADEKPAALAAIVDRVGRGRAAAVRPPSQKELDATAVVVFTIEEASAKQREGGPLDEAEDLAWPVWAGHVPLCVTALAPVPASDLRGEHPAPCIDLDGLRR
jgi:nitroimidazol reductase NimA-like FMN-containing flavoprotein (pyridoxamine 5'-phosphate oxidase superfamily)